MGRFIIHKLMYGQAIVDYLADCVFIKPLGKNNVRLRVPFADELPQLLAAVCAVGQV